MLSKIILTILFLFPSIASAMDMDKFQDMLDKIDANDFGVVEQFLEENRTGLNKDPEYYVILLNYSFAKGSQTQLVVAKGEPREGDFAALEDMESGEIVGYIGNRLHQDVELILKGITETQKALSFFNNRLDIHFGIVHIASLIKHWDIVSMQLVEILKVSKVIDNEWEWGSINSMNGDSRKFMLENVQGRVSELFHVGSEETDNAIKAVSEKMIKEYPDVIYGYSNLGVIYLANGKYDLAEKYLNQAISIDPEDEIVRGNLDILKEKKSMAQPQL